MSAHTEGPWSAGNLSDGWSVLDASNNLVAFIGRDDMETGDNCKADARLIAAAPDMLTALRLHQAWADSERAGPDYGGQSRDTHPDGESIWRKWWNNQLDLCDRATDATRAALTNRCVMLSTDRYEPMAPCPHCFESSGYEARCHPDTWSEPGWAEPDPCRPCPFCDHTGYVPASEVGPDDERDEDFHDPGYLAAIDRSPRHEGLTASTVAGAVNLLDAVRAANPNNSEGAM